MASRARILFLATAVAIPCLAFAHNGRDAGPPKKAADKQKAAPVDFFSGIQVTTDPKTGVRSYVQVGDIPDNPGSGKPFVYDEATMGPGIDYWVQKSLESPPPAYAPALNYIPADTSYSQVEMYDEGYYNGYGYGYGGYLPYGGGGGRPGRPGHGHGDRPGHGGGGPGDGNGGAHPSPRDRLARYSPPAGPPGGGVGSPTPYPFEPVGVGAPTYYPFDATRAPARGRR